MTVVPTEGSRFQAMEQAVELEYRGLSELQIAREMGIPRKEVKLLLADYKEALRNDPLAADLARDHLNRLIKHYDKLIFKSYDLIKDIDVLDFNHQVAAQKNSAIKLIADLERQRLELIQKAGLLDGMDNDAELEAMEEKQEILIDILRNDLCPSCRAKVAHKLGQVTGQAEVVSVETISG